MILALMGVVILLLGVSAATTFEAKVGSVDVKTTSTGLALLVVGSALSAGVAIKLPENVQVFGPTPATMTERLSRLAGPLALLAIAAGVALVISVMVA